MADLILEGFIELEVNPLELLLTLIMPVLDTHAVSDFLIGNLPLCLHHAKLSDRWTVPGNAWVEASELLELDNDRLLVDAEGEVLARPADGIGNGIQVLTKNSFLIRHSWDLLRANELYLRSLQESEISGEVHPLAVIEGVVKVGEGTRILPGVFIEGNVVIGKNCKIGPNCYLRGYTSIGDGCHVGNAVEIKNSIILSKTNVGHLSYVGDSILGERVNLGAGTMVSNLRHDGKNHRTMVDGCLIDTGRRKFGTIIGDDVHTGINTAIYPGRKLFPGVSTAPGEVVKNDLNNNK